MDRTNTVSRYPHLDNYIDWARQNFIIAPLKGNISKKIIAMGDSTVQVVGQTTPKVVNNFCLSTRYPRRITNDDGKKLSAQLQCKKSYPGGTINSLSMIAAKLGANVELFSNVGKDINGNFIIDHTRTKNLKPTFSRSNHQNTSINRVALFGNNKRAGASYIDASLTAVQIPKEKFKDSGYYVTNAQYFCDSNNHMVMMENIRNAKNNGAKIVMRLQNPSLIKNITNILNDLIKKEYIDIIIGGEAEISTLFKMQYLSNLKRPVSLDVLRSMVIDTAQKTGKHFVITYGKNGADIVSKDGLFRIKPTKMNSIKNTFGVGNAFSGGYLSALAHGLTNHEAGIIASEVASSAVTSEGPYPSDKTLQHIREKMLELVAIKKNQRRI